MPRPESADDWRTFRNLATCRGTPLHRLGIHALLSSVGYSNECVSMIRNLTGFSAPFNLPAASGAVLQLLGNFPEHPEFFTLRAGYERLAAELVEGILAAGGEIRSGYRVTALEESALGVRVTAANESVFPCSVTCSHVILALPRLGLPELARRSNIFSANPRLLVDLESVVTMALVKINLYYRERWWHSECGVRSGGEFHGSAARAGVLLRAGSRRNRSWAGGADPVWRWIAVALLAGASGRRSAVYDPGVSRASHRRIFRNHSHGTRGAPPTAPALREEFQSLSRFSLA